MEGERRKVLFVDDDLVDRMAFTRMVAEQGLPYDYTLCRSTAEAKGLVWSEPFDVAILDYYLGDGTAFDLYAPLEGIPIIIITGTGTEEVAVKAIREGAYDYLIKDIDRNYLKVLPVTVENAIEHKKAVDRFFWLASVAESSADAVIGLSTDGKIISWNKGAEKIYGYTPEEVLYKPCSFLFKADHLDAIDTGLERIRKGETVCDCNTTGLAKDGSSMDISLSLSPIYSSAGSLMGVSAIMRDISERKKLEIEKTKFLAMVTHDLKSPLTTILGYSELLMDESFCAKVHDTRDIMRHIHSSGTKLLGMVDDFLMISKLETGRLELNPEPYEIKKLVTNISEEFVIRATNKGISFELEVPDGLPPVSMDRRYMDRVLANLLDNAVSYTPEGGKVSVRAWIASGEGGSCLAIAVSDTGIGIPQSDQERVFEMYFRTRATEGIRGTGLGLAIAKSITEATGGHIELRSEPGKGSTFTIMFPVTQSDNCRLPSKVKVLKTG